MRMEQQTLAMAADQGAGFEQYRRATKRDLFLETMQQIVPWTQAALYAATAGMRTNRTITARGGRRTAAGQPT
jgi:hypothetical protein